MGRRIWVVHPATDGVGQMVYDTDVKGLKQFLPAGPVASGQPPSFDGRRDQHLVQLFTDHGTRTLAVAEVRLKDPRKSKAA